MTLAKRTDIVIKDTATQTIKDTRMDFLIIDNWNDKFYKAKELLKSSSMLLHEDINKYHSEGTVYNNSV
jgi:hypothetical protein